MVGDALLSELERQEKYLAQLPENYEFPLFNARQAVESQRRSGRLTEDDIRALIAALGSLLDVIRNAGPAEKAAIYDQLGLKITFKPGQAKIRGYLSRCVRSD